jgi:cytochrome b561
MIENRQDTINESWPMPKYAIPRTGGGLLAHATSTRHATLTVVLHWSTLAAIVIAVASIYLRELTEEKVIRQVLLEAHRQLGLLVLVGVPLRIAVRYWLGFSDQTSAMPVAARMAATACHLALYAGLLALPLLGWAATSAKEITLSLFGLLPLPGLVAPDPDLVDALLDYHKWTAWAFGVLVVLHALAALWHHFGERDGILAAMLPSVRRLTAGRGKR